MGWPGSINGAEDNYTGRLKWKRKGTTRTVQYSTVQYSTVQYSTVQYSTWQE